MNPVNLAYPDLCLRATARQASRVSYVDFRIGRDHSENWTLEDDNPIVKLKLYAVPIGREATDPGALGSDAKGGEALRIVLRGFQHHPLRSSLFFFYFFFSSPR
jgi:hypothetical protein